jgi:DNA topoisomerase-2
MSNVVVKIDDFINKEYKEYGFYTMFRRGIPAFEDGMTPVQRKILYVAQHNLKSFQPMLKLIGGVTEIGYHHGDKSSFDASVNMAVDYKASNNNVNILIGYGNFGNRLFRESASARYIKARYNKLCDHIFLDEDLYLKNEEDIALEPVFYYPIIPMLLVNHRKGIALGYSCNIPPHNPIDIINQMRLILNGSDRRITIYPYWKGLKCDVQYDGERFCIYGEYEKLGLKKVKITELPPAYDREKIIKILNELEDKKIITSYTDNSIDGDFNIEVRFTRNVDEINVYKVLRLYQYETYNLTCIKSDKIKNYSNVYDIIEDFIEWRLRLYDLRFKTYVKNLKRDIKILKAKKAFIKKMIMQIIKNKGIVKKSQISNMIDNDEYRDKLINIPIYNMNDDFIESIDDSIRLKKDEIEVYKSMDIKKAFLRDLNMLKLELKKNGF